MRSCPHRSALVLALLVGAPALPARAQEVRKLNPPLARAILASVRDPALTPDGGEVLYRADLVHDEVFELWASPADGSGGARRLSQALSHGGVASFRIAPDGQRVVYRVDRTGGGTLELYSVPLDGSLAPVRLNLTLAPGGNVASDFLISPDGARVAYRAEQDTAGVQELYGVPIDRSSAPIRLSGVLAGGGDVTEFLFAPDGERLVYRADALTDEVFELFVTGFHQAPLRLSDPPATGGDVQASLGRHFSVSAERAVYLAEAVQSGRCELFSVPLDRSLPPVRLHPALPAGRSVEDFALAPDGSRAAFRTDLDTPGLLELYAAALDGASSPVKLNGALLAGGGVMNPLGPAFAIAPDSTRLAFLARHDSTAPLHLFAASLDGSAAAVALDAGLDLVQVTRVGFTPDAQRALFTASGIDGGLWVASLDGGAPLRLDAGLPEGASATELEATDEAVIFLALENGGTKELFASPLDGAAPARRLNREPAAGGGVERFALRPDGAGVVYHADQDVPGALELFGVALAGGLPWRINDPLPGGPVVGDVHGFTLSPDGGRVVFAAEAYQPQHYGLFEADLETPGPARELSDRPGAASSFLRRYAYAPDGSTVAYVREAEGLVFAAPTGGDAPPRLLGELPPSGGEPNVLLELGADSHWLVYREHSVFFPYIVFQSPWAVPLDGSLAARALDTSAAQLRIEPRSLHLVYTNATSTGLFRARLDGATGPSRLDRIRVAGGTVAEFRVTTDGRQVVYRAEQERPGTFELYLTSLVGKQEPRKLSPAPLRLGGVLGPFELHGREVVFAFDRDGQLALYATSLAKGGARKLAGLRHWAGTLFVTPAGRVLYHDLPVSGTALHVFSVPLDGSSPALDLCTSLTPDRSASFVQVSGERVLYQAETSPGVVELWSVPASGGTDPERLNATLPPGERVRDFRIAGNWVVYRTADSGLYGDLYRVPLDGLAPAQRISPDFLPLTRVSLYEVTADGSRVVYVADQETDEVFELYEIRL